MMRFKLEQIGWSLRFFWQSIAWEHLRDVWRIALYKPRPDDGWD